MEQVCCDGIYPVATLDDATTCWRLYIELYIRQGQNNEALQYARQALQSTMPLQQSTSVSYKNIILKKSIPLWNLLLDLEENYGTIQTTKDAYTSVLETKLVTIQHILNYSTYLIQYDYYEEAFRCYERGIELFPNFPACKVLWKTYLSIFVQRYKGTKIERTRNLFQRCIEVCPPEYCIDFIYYMDNTKNNMDLL